MSLLPEESSTWTNEEKISWLKNKSTTLHTVLNSQPFPFLTPDETCVYGETRDEACAYGAEAEALEDNTLSPRPWSMSPGWSPGPYSYEASIVDANGIKVVSGAEGINARSADLLLIIKCVNEAYALETASTS